MIVKKISGSNNRLIIMLHGTGGDENDLLPLGKFLDPKATLVGIRGLEQEDGMNRYFKRFPDGTFDLNNLKKNTEILYEKINEIIKEFSNHQIIILGYSNGANILINILKKYQVNYHQVILLHPININEQVSFKEQKDLKLLMTYGNNDPLVDKDNYQELVNHLKKTNINIREYIHDFSHQITMPELEEVKLFINE